MSAVARSYIADAELLNEATAKASDGAYLLELIAFEILLKAVRLAHGLKQERNHSFAALFGSLLIEVQQGLLAAAKTRVGQTGDYANLEMLLATFQHNFVALRYS
jgi:hypothetical protein